MQDLYLNIHQRITYMERCRQDRQVVRAYIRYRHVFGQDFGTITAFIQYRHISGQGFDTVAICIYTYIHSLFE
jgi:hypothetical protein